MKVEIELNKKNFGFRAVDTLDVKFVDANGETYGISEIFEPETDRPFKSLFKLMMERAMRNFEIMYEKSEKEKIL